MPIKWNKVTWYSKLLAVIIFVLTFYIAYSLGNIHGQEKADTTVVSTNAKTAPIKVPVNAAPVSITSQKIKEENFSGTMPIISGSGSLAENARVYILQKITDFKAEANADVPDMQKKFGSDSPMAQYTLDIGAKYVKSETTGSIVISIYAYTGGANGNSSYKVITASLPDEKNSAKILSLSNFIKEDKQTAFTRFVKDELNNWRPEGNDFSAVFTDEVNSLKFDSFKNWSLDDKNLTIYFDKYEIGPGYLGAVAFPLSLDKIKDFLKPTFHFVGSGGGDQ